jgi:hypothetical protein
LSAGQYAGDRIPESEESTIAVLGKRSCDVQQATLPAFETFETWMVTWLYTLFGLGIARFG